MKTFLQITILLLSTNFLFAWGPNGHRIVAQVCELHLSPMAKTKIENLLGKDYLAEIATWPDFIRSEKNWDFTSEWHYTTIDPDKTANEIILAHQEDSTINSALDAIQLMTAILEGDAKSKRIFDDLMRKNKVTPFKNSTEATALAFLVHLVGDIHQPMHVGKNKDLGGNKISVLFFNEKSNLHSVWDSGIIDKEQLSYTEFTRFINKLSPAEVADLQSHSIKDWTEESITAREHIYNTLYDYTDRESGLPSFSYQYQHDNINIVKERLLRGGIRTAGILNRIFK